MRGSFDDALELLSDAIDDAMGAHFDAGRRDTREVAESRRSALATVRDELQRLREERENQLRVTENVYGLLVDAKRERNSAEAALAEMRRALARIAVLPHGHIAPGIARRALAAADGTPECEHYWRPTGETNQDRCSLCGDYRPADGTPKDTAMPRQANSQREMADACTLHVGCRAGSHLPECPLYGTPKDTV